MIRSAKVLVLASVLAAVSLAQTAPAPGPNSSAAGSNHAAAYYNYAMGRLYALMAQSEGSQEQALKAIQYFKDALKADPKASEVYGELTDLYLELQKPADAIALAQDALKQDPDNVDAHRMLGRVYFSMIQKGGNQAQRTDQIDERALRLALQEFQKVTEKDPKDVDSWVALGHLYSGNNDSPNSEKAYNAALAVDPDNEEALTGLAMVYGNMGNTGKAIEKLKAATEKNPNVRSLMILAQAYENMDPKDYKDAADALRKALELQPENERLARSLADDLLFSDQTDEALKVYQSLAAGSPKDPLIPLRIAEIYRSKHDFANAHKAIDQAKKIDPDGLEPRQEEVGLFVAEAKPDQAITALKSILDDTARKVYSKTDAQQRAEWCEQLGELQRETGHYSEAIDSFKQIGVVVKDSAPLVAAEIIETYRSAKDLVSAQREADADLKKFPDEYPVARAHADVLGDLGKIDDAAKELRGLLNGPRDRETLVDLADVYEKGKRFVEAGQAVDDAEKLSTTDEEKAYVCFVRGALLERQKKYKESEDSFRKAISLNPQDHRALNYLGYMLADQNQRLDEAYTLIQKAVDLDPGNGAYLDSLGWVYFRQGKLAEAESFLVKAVDLTGQDPTVHEHLGEVYYKLGKTKEAITQWTASVKAYKEQPATETDPEDLKKVSAELDAARTKLAAETKR
jgi:tetratricopeptide (TPR) repeat protein